MKHSSTLFLKLSIVVLGFLVLVGMLWLPQTEGRAVNLDLISIYSDPFILFVYVASIPFFVGLYQAFKLLSLIDADQAFSPLAITTLRNMKYASFCMIAGIVLSLGYIRFFVQGEDAAGPTMMGFILALAFGVIATAAGVLQQLFLSAGKIKSENDSIV